jgi:membrane-associated phospholipid phosphatase
MFSITKPGGSPAVGKRPALHVERLDDRCLPSADVVLQWNEVLLDAIRTSHTAPPPASRNLAIMHVAIFDAVNSIDRLSAPYLVKKGGPKGASAEAAAARAAHDTLAALYPDLKATIDAALHDSLAAVPDGRAERQGIAVGRYVAKKVLRARRNDGADAVVPYAPGTDPGDWQPTPPGFAASQFPQWANVEPFAMTDAGQFRPTAPPALTSADYAAAFNEVKDLGGDGVTTPTSRTPEQTLIANFWADGAGTETPPGHWNTIAEDVARARGLSLVQDARLFALLNIALADAAIDAWDCKYEFNLWRPVTAIRAADLDGNPATAPDPTWTPLLATPAFPSYMSGHSTFSSAGAAVLANFFGTDAVAFTTGSDAMPGTTRTFTSFSAAAAEAGQSRIYGGIHYQFDNQAGLTSGHALGEYVAGHFLTPIQPLRVGRGQSVPAEAGPKPIAAGVDPSGLGGIGIRAADSAGGTDQSPHRDTDVARSANQDEQHRVDLLTVVMQEAGVQAATLAIGVRPTATAARNTDALLASDVLLDGRRSEVR